MSPRDFLDGETTTTAYLGKHAYDLFLLCSTQAEDIYRERGIVFPVTASSTVQYLHRHGVMALTDIAKALDLPHQLVAQRIDKLIKVGLVRRKPDAKDRRRFTLQLTKKGTAQAVRLEACMADVAEVYKHLFEEIGCDLSVALIAARAAMIDKPLSKRLAKLFSETSNG